ncbi:YjbE family integral membrane protein [Sporomusaceae bacterium BoRhaA]|uniref:TerC family protein n=1 Tax=Pelorhabdus rhamnosifermentans TaxID=2772457 RepID=UPI001C061548|nr:TerC family protein [Pelorhabdus rhamnosifermentans]MBU2702420.1 YjbE family integral membrane protein [Pelorhabdus rhamnosifermentans]
MVDFMMYANSEWLLALGGIILIDLLLGGDNAVLIALASKNLTPKQRKKVVLIGSIGAIVARIVLIFIASFLLKIPYLQFLGGIALVWIAVNLAGQDNKDMTSLKAQGVAQAVKAILVADVIMSLDNVLALAALSQTASAGQYALIILGVMVSIPMIVFGSQVLMKLMDRYPVIIYIGTGVLGYAAAEMIISDKALGLAAIRYELLIKVGLALSVILLGYFKKHEKLKLILEK